MIYLHLRLVSAHPAGAPAVQPQVSRFPSPYPIADGAPRAGRPQLGVAVGCVESSTRRRLEKAPTGGRDSLGRSEVETKNHRNDLRKGFSDAIAPTHERGTGPANQLHWEPVPTPLRLTVAREVRHGMHAIRGGRDSMPTPQSADAEFEQEHMEHVVLLNRAFADGIVSPDEAEAIRRHYLEEVTPLAEDLSTSFRAIHSITRTKGGVYGYRFQRMCKQAWARRGESNVVDLFPRVPLDAA